MREDGFLEYMPAYQQGPLLGMTTASEHAFAHHYARDLYTGEGAIIDLGCWMGALTIPLVEGLRQNRTAAASTRRVDAIDRFHWQSWMGDVAVGRAVRGQYQPGESFRREFDERVRPWSDRIATHEVDLRTYEWTGGEIEFIYVDAMKDWELNLAVARTFFSHLIPGRSIVVFQDFGYNACPWQQLFCWQHRRSFEPLFPVRWSTSMVFRFTRALSQDLLVPGTDDRSFTRDEIDEAFAWATNWVVPFLRHTFPRAKVRCLESRGEAPEALAIAVEDATGTIEDATGTIEELDPGSPRRFRIHLDGPCGERRLCLRIGRAPIGIVVRSFVLEEESGRSVPLSMHRHDALLQDDPVLWFEGEARLWIDVPAQPAPCRIDVEIELVGQGPAIWPAVAVALGRQLAAETEARDVARQETRKTAEALSDAQAEILRLKALAAAAPQASATRESPAAATPAIVSRSGPAVVRSGPPATPATGAARPASQVQRAIETVKASGVFDVEFYLERNPDVAAAGMDPVSHYVSSGDREGRRPHPLFDPVYYREHCPEADAMGCTTLEHYLAAGAKQGHNPSMDFDTVFYLSSNPDVASANLNPLVHFVRSGASEGRTPRRFTPPAFKRAPRDPAPLVVPRGQGAIPVIFSSSDWGISGVNTFTATLASGLSQAGFAPLILLSTALSDEDRSHLPRDLPVRPLPCGDGSLTARWNALSRTLTAAAPCIFVPNYDFAMAAVCPGLPDSVGVVGILHSDDDVHYEQIYRLARYWNAVVSVSTYLERRVQDLNASLVPVTRYIPYGIGVERAVPPRPRPVEPGRLAIVYTGRLEQGQKRIRDLVPIVRELEGRGVPFTLTVVGEGPERAWLETELASGIGRGTVVMTGRLPEDRIREILSRSDVFLLLSNFEGLPLSLLEAMAQGVVPVVSAVPSGIPDIVQDRVSGCIVPIGETLAFASRLRELAGAPDQLAGMSVAARTAVVDGGFDAETMIARYAALFSGIANDLCSGTYRRPAPFLGPTGPGRFLPPSWLQVDEFRWDEIPSANDGDDRGGGR